jgi:O-antigen/teichoic acid export membrane protein
MSDAAPLTADAGVVKAVKPTALPQLVTLLLRYVFSALGPMSIAGAHFIAALIFLRTMQRADFGLFSFVFIVVPFCLSMTGAMFGASMVRSANRAEPMSADELAAYMKANLVFAGLCSTVVFGLMLGGSASPGLAAIVALYGGIMTTRWFARCHAYATHNMSRAVISDVVYSTMLIGGLLVLTFGQALSPTRAATVLVVCSLCALMAFGREFLFAQAQAIFTGSLRAFVPVWRDLARWSMLGVISTELTANAHAYLVTFVSGPKAFALLAVGSLFMRPVSLVITALPDAERPAMAQAIAQNNVTRALRSVFEFRIASLTVLAASAVLAAVIMVWFPQLILKRGYDEASVIAVICLWIVVMGVRALRTPESIFLQVVGEFRSLAGASVRSSIVSILLTLALLLAFGPLVSLLGILAGDLVMTSRIFALGRQWRAEHV